MIDPRLIRAQIRHHEEKLDATLEDAKSTRGALNDALKVVVPMMKDQLQVMRDVLSYAESNG